MNKQVKKLQTQKAELLEKSYKLVQLSQEWEKVIAEIRSINEKIYAIKNKGQDTEFCSIDQGDCRTRIIAGGKEKKI
jgi:predicted  nucleic acid-binding Zn-ribbon protein